MFTRLMNSLKVGIKASRNSCLRVPLAIIKVLFTVMICMIGYPVIFGLFLVTILMAIKKAFQMMDELMGSIFEKSDKVYFGIVYATAPIIRYYYGNEYLAPIFVVMIVHIILTIKEWKNEGNVAIVPAPVKVSKAKTPKNA